MRKVPTSCSSISIHALREEGDTAHRPPSSCPCHFYPRPPRGGRRAGYVVIGDTLVFLSTPSARRATRTHHGARHTVHISIRALREEGD